MARYFIEVAYKGTAYSGFQVQENAVTIQSKLEEALKTLHRNPIQLTGSSRTDAGVHALQNFFHFDYANEVHPQAVYKLNAILPSDIAVKTIRLVHNEAHSRFDATSREYIYRLHTFKDPFLENTSLFYPYKLNKELLEQGAEFIAKQKHFFAFAKTNTQVNNFDCTILKSQWQFDANSFLYNIEANRFLRGMVRLLTATLLKLGRESISFSEFRSFFSVEKKCGFSVPSHGLYLKRVSYPSSYSSLNK